MDYFTTPPQLESYLVSLLHGVFSFQVGIPSMTRGLGFATLHCVPHYITRCNTCITNTTKIMDCTPTKNPHQNQSTNPLPRHYCPPNNWPSPHSSDTLPPSSRKSSSSPPN
mmetsp:Transcript_13208/g.23934  ORF Transcript_13208/g.23934 Transcript_13208/m.23934 type:complete len:111 (+) Transcript_13208:29-361(+)